MAPPKQPAVTPPLTAAHLGGRHWRDLPRTTPPNAWEPVNLPDIVSWLGVRDGVLVDLLHERAGRPSILVPSDPPPDVMSAPPG